MKTPEPDLEQFQPRANLEDKRNYQRRKYHTGAHKDWLNARYTIYLWASAENYTAFTLQTSN